MTKQVDVRDPGRRAFLGAAAIGTTAVLAGAVTPGAAQAAEGPAPQVDFPDTPGSFGGGPAGTNNRAEIDLYDCEVEGTLPDLDGVFYRVGPDPQYPKDPKYAASNAKRSRALGYWISYRQACPDEQWRGERNRTTVTAAAPSDKPLLYEKDAPTHVEPPSNDAGTGDDSDIPF